MSTPELQIDQRFIDCVVARAQNSMMSLGEPEGSYSIANYEYPPTIESAAILLVTAHTAKYDLVSLMAAAMEEVKEQLELSHNELRTQLDEVRAELANVRTAGKTLVQSNDKLFDACNELQEQLEKERGGTVQTKCRTCGVVQWTRDYGVSVVCGACTCREFEEEANTLREQLAEAKSYLEVQEAVSSELTAQQEDTVAQLEEARRERDEERANYQRLRGAVNGSAPVDLEYMRALEKDHKRMEAERDRALADLADARIAELKRTK